MGVAPDYFYALRVQHVAAVVVLVVLTGLATLDEEIFVMIRHRVLALRSKHLTRLQPGHSVLFMSLIHTLY